MFGTIDFPQFVGSNIFSPQDLLVIAVIFLLFFGGKKIPEMAKGLGEGIRNFKNAVKRRRGRRLKEATGVRLLRPSASCAARSAVTVNKQDPARQSRGVRHYCTDRGRLLLLRRNDRVFHGLGYAELHDLLCRDLDRFPGGRIAADAGLPIHSDQTPDTRDDEYTVLLGFANRQFRELSRRTPWPPLWKHCWNRPVRGSPAIASTWYLLPCSSPYPSLPGGLKQNPSVLFTPES